MKSKKTDTQYTNNPNVAAWLAAFGFTPEIETKNGATIYTYQFNNQTIKVTK